MDVLNKVMVVGNLTRDPEVRDTRNGKKVAKLGLAVDSGGGRDSADGAEPVFLDVILWERNAENAETYLKKGSGILLEGRLQMSRWEDKQTGQSRSKIRVVGERVRFLELAREGAAASTPG